jgi:hypothetical protein
MSLGSGGAAGAIQAGKAFVSLAADDTELKKALARARDSVQKFGIELAKTGAAMAAAGAALFGPLTKLFVDSVTRANSFSLLASQFGDAGNDLATLAEAFEKAGISQGAFAESAGTLQRSLNEAQAGAAGASEAFEALGLSSLALAGLPLDERLGAVGKALAGVKDEAMRAQLATRLLGANGGAAVQFLADGGQELRRLVSQTSTTVETLSALSYAFETVGVSAEQFADGIKGLQQKLSLAADGNDVAFRRLGLNARELIKLPLDQQLIAIGDSLGRVTNAGDRTRIAMETLGDGGVRALKLISGGGAELRRLMEQAGQVGAVVTGEQARQGRAIASAWAATLAAVKAVLFGIGAAILPASDVIEGFAAGLVKVVGQVRGWINENKALILQLAAASLAAIVAGVATAGVGAALVALSAVSTPTLGLLALGWNAVATSAGLAWAVMTLPLDPVILAVLGVTAAITAAVVALFKFTDVGKQATAFWTGEFWTAVSTASAEISAAFKRVLSVATQTIGGVVSALKRGDLAAAGKIAGAGLEIAWAESMFALKKLWTNFSTWWVNQFDASGVQIQNIWSDVVDGIRDLFVGVITAITAKLAEVADAAGLTSLAGQLKIMGATTAGGVTAAAAAAGGGADQRVADLGKRMLNRQGADNLALGEELGIIDKLKAGFVELLRIEAAKAASSSPPPRPDTAAMISQQVRGVLASVANVQGTLGIGDKMLGLRQLDETKKGNSVLQQIYNAIVEGKMWPKFS